MNGLTHQASPIFIDKKGEPIPCDKDQQPVCVDYENGFQSIDGKRTIFQQQTGNRKFDLNYDGIAHYGLLADHVESIRLNGDSHTINVLFKSAEAYLQMWERVNVGKSE